MEPKERSFLRDCRKHLKLTTKALASKMKMDASVITRIEYGREPCGEVRARRFGDFFKRPWELFVNKGRED